MVSLDRIMLAQRVDRGELIPATKAELYFAIYRGRSGSSTPRSSA